MTVILLIAGQPWLYALLVLGIYGFAPEQVLRLVVHFYPKGSDRRKELIAELRVVPRKERPFWLAEQLTIVVAEGLKDRRHSTARNLGNSDALIARDTGS